ncbi:hypothetical protein [Leptolyngbya sp. FACHB-261]|nr:hypothetical protein [Leptolyngbya sp. FACHB-261]MBD2099994.1 hypothetical protein [Leptolyngbya sp. FACHB-261]
MRVELYIVDQVNNAQSILEDAQEQQNIRNQLCQLEVEGKRYCDKPSAKP